MQKQIPKLVTYAEDEKEDGDFNNYGGHSRRRSDYNSDRPSSSYNQSVKSYNGSKDESGYKSHRRGESTSSSTSSQWWNHPFLQDLSVVFTPA